MLCHFGAAEFSGVVRVCCMCTKLIVSISIVGAAPCGRPQGAAPTIDMESSRQPL